MDGILTKITAIKYNIKMAQTPLKVGFDLDGVLIYNPLRVVRPFISGFKKLFLKQKTLKFYYPKTEIEKKIWDLLHKSSIFIAPGYKKILELVKKGKIEAYLITARYRFLRPDFEKWVKKLKADKYFKGCYLNENDEQPHIFKYKMIERLNLDIFVEDNWDIVNYLYSKFKRQGKKTKVFWVYNIMDRKIKYKHKIPQLRNLLEFLEK